MSYDFEFRLDAPYLNVIISQIKYVGRNSSAEA